MYACDIFALEYLVKLGQLLLVLPTGNDAGADILSSRKSDRLNKILLHLPRAMTKVEPPRAKSHVEFRVQMNRDESVHCLE